MASDDDLERAAVEMVDDAQDRIEHGVAKAAKWFKLIVRVAVSTKRIADQAADLGRDTRGARCR